MPSRRSSDDIFMLMAAALTLSWAWAPAKPPHSTTVQ
jgi:hypothetical protein